MLQKRQLLSTASCVLAPIIWEEPFGLFMAEANACGTPVIALKRGAAPEVVWHGHTGFVVESLGEMAEAVGRIKEIDPAACRQHVEKNFSVARMADDYLAAYAKVLRVPSFSAVNGASSQRPLDPRTIEGPAQATLSPKPSVN
jgi:glycosyltransferase involved in cell wall biosynthesis